MSLPLPEILSAYFAAANARDSEKASACFSSAAIVRDEGRAHSGRAAIRDWIEEAGRKYEPRVEIRQATEKDGDLVVTGLVSGNFPGSPVELDFAFTLRDGLIANLRIL